MKKRILGLDLLRDIGVIFIFLYHFCIEYINLAHGTDPAMPSLNYFVNIWARPASLFLFIISGYALMYNQEHELSLKDYFRRRFKGLFIPFYIAYTIAFIACFAVNNLTVGSPAPLYTFIYTIFGVDAVAQELNNGLGFYLVGEWFMSCIVICYLIFPLLAKLMKRFKYVALGVLAIWNVLLLFFWNPFNIQVEHNPLFIILYFYIGMLMYEKYGQKEIPKSLRTSNGIVAIIAFAFLLVAGYTSVVGMVSPEAFEIICVGWSMAMFLALRDLEISPEKKSYKAITYISGISWYVILVHHIIIILLFTHYNFETYTRRETFTMLLLTIALTWLGAEAIRKLTTKVKNLFK